LIVPWKHHKQRRAENSGMSPLAKVVYAISNVLIHYIPILLGLFIFASACIGYGKPPVKWYVRFSVGVVRLLLLFLGIRLLIAST
jgi:hypothetical protein